MNGYKFQRYKNQLIAVGGLIGISRCFIDISNTVVSDYNNYKRTGSYTLSSIEIPNSPGFEAGILLVFSSNGFIIQVAVNYTTTLIKTRGKSNWSETWTNWRQIQTL